MLFPWRDLNPSNSTPWVTWGTMLLCVLALMFQMVQPIEAQRGIVMAYALVPARITTMFSEGFDAGAVLSVFASMFMHGGLPHIVGNMWFLRIFGDNVEDNFGSLRFAAFYLLCGVGAAAAQVLVDPYSGLPMVGASGAIAGVLAAYLVLYPRARVQTFVFLFVFFSFVELPAFVVIAVWFVLQFFSGVLSLGVHSGGGVAYWAHIGGFVSGLVLALLFRKRPPAAAVASALPPRWDPDADWR